MHAMLRGRGVRGGEQKQGGRHVPGGLPDAEEDCMGQTVRKSMSCRHGKLVCSAQAGVLILRGNRLKDGHQAPSQHKRQPSA